MTPNVLDDWLWTAPFGEISQFERDLLARECTVIEIRRKQKLYTQGQERDAVYVILNGFVQQVRQFGESDTVTVAVLGPGEMLGLLGVHEQSTYKLSAQAISDGIAIKIPTPVVAELLRGDSGFLKVVAEMLATHLSQAYRSITQSGYARVDQRILSALLECGSRYGVESGGRIALKIPLTRREIAEISHTTVETTIRTLSKWERAGWVQTKNRMITLQCVDCLVEQVLNRS